jgi:hypothetical protein
VKSAVSQSMLPINQYSTMTANQCYQVPTNQYSTLTGSRSMLPTKEYTTMTANQSMLPTNAKQLNTMKTFSNYFSLKCDICVKNVEESEIYCVNSKGTVCLSCHLSYADACEVIDKNKSDCTFCQKSFYADKLLINHQKREHRKAWLESDKIFRSNYELKNHIESVHGKFKEAELECNICVKRFGGKSNVNQHLMSVHAEAKEFKCQSCGKTFGIRKFHIRPQRFDV